MMSLLVAGRLVRDPEQKTSKNGKTYVQALLLVSAGDAEILVTVMAFDSDLQALLNGLKKGDNCSACGSGSIRAYFDKEEQPAVGITLMVNRLMAMTEGKAATRSKEASARVVPRRTEGQYSVAAPAAELPPVEAYEDSF